MEDLKEKYNTKSENESLVQSDKNLKAIENKSAYIPSWNYKPEGEVLAYYKGSCYTSYDCSSN